MMNRFIVALGFAFIASAAQASNVLPGSGATVTGTSLYPGFDSTAAAHNLIEGPPYQQAYFNTDTRWVFANGDISQALVVDLHTPTALNSFSILYGADRAPAFFEILTSNDGTHFTALGSTIPFFDGSPHLFTATVNGFVDARYIEYYFGIASPAAPDGGNGAGIVQLTASIPEPSTWAMMILGFLGVGYMIRRRNRQFSLPA
ncbi:discoidin domain-containing protein [Bradyrhizobium sp. INPA01-394B]|uniref:Discoidin domain-containing protein n=1 Tax=Bradyrhizobium campsiandrae TaxID=1729892 RepID=A0ABR7UBR2_9BRAD|nr:PEPxxWA-CTERM sorting domain-containing protein [Bradyrhizobium campsiandrae]MBC9882131.1 discoidin domain-containing protein [Bradyrhizobium campsiandrae]MBC9981045.1 discoidin domain-containing protein [Bradyrhizobium campsiandrae]